MAATKLLNPHVMGLSSIITTLPVLAIDFSSVSLSKGSRLRGSNTSIDKPSSSNFLAALKATGCAGTFQPAPGRICASK